MYQNNIDNIDGVTVKICDRITLDMEAQTASEAEIFIIGSGYERAKDYRTEGNTYTFLLNEFADLKELIPLKCRHIEYKAKLTLFKIF